MEADRAVWITEDFLSTAHGRMDCMYCHGGQKFARTRAEAHEDMEPRPSAAYAESVCQPCHAKISDTFGASLHVEIEGIIYPESAVARRVGENGDMEAVEKGLEANCSGCHVSGCGDCHVSRPQSNGGGFVNGHVFSAKPISTLNCMGCHGSRIQKEYTGAGESTKAALTPDVHWSGGLQCYNCHDTSWIHGGDEYSNRYKAPAAPKCDYCHATTDGFLSSEMHAAHADPEGDVLLQCQVCHSQDYNNCTACHVGVDKNDIPSFSTASSYYDFKIGRNYQQSDDKPWDFIVVRQVPVDEETFAYYGENAFGDFAAIPTFKYATPHNISAVTRQTEKGCDSCHEDDDLFLTAKDLADLPEAERKANESVAIDR